MKKLLYCDQKHNLLEYIYSPYDKKDCMNKHLFDFYSITHIFFFMLITFVLDILKFKKNTIIIIGIIITFISELKENSKEGIQKYRRSGYENYTGDSLLNIIGDVISNSLGIILVLSINNNSIKVFILISLAIIITVIEPKFWINYYKYLT